MKPPFPLTAVPFNFLIPIQLARSRVYGKIAEGVEHVVTSIIRKHKLTWIDDPDKPRIATPMGGLSFQLSRVGIAHHLSLKHCNPMWF